MGQSELRNEEMVCDNRESPSRETDGKSGSGVRERIKWPF
jgi:hypothetical protein